MEILPSLSALDDLAKEIKSQIKEAVQKLMNLYGINETFVENLSATKLYISSLGRKYITNQELIAYINVLWRDKENKLENPSDAHQFINLILGSLGMNVVADGVDPEKIMYLKK